MEKQTEKIWIVEECQFPLDKNPEWYECCKFANEDEAQEFAWNHYASRTNFNDGADTCKCKECADGWKVDPTWWKSYSVRVRNTQTGKES